MSKKCMAFDMSLIRRQAAGAFSVLVLCGLSSVSSANAESSIAESSNAESSIAVPSQEFSARVAMNDAGSDSLLLEEALLVAERIEDLEHKSIALAGIANAYAELEAFDQADELLGRALQGVEQELEQGAEPETSKVLNRIAVGYFAIGEKERAVELLGRSLAAVGEIRSRTRNYDYLLEIVELYAQFEAHSGLEDAARVADEIADEFRCRYALEKIVIAYGQLNDRAIANTGITQIYQHLETINDSLSGRLRSVGKTSTRIAIAEARARLSETEAVLELLAPELQSDSLYSLGEIADVYGLMQDSVMAKASLDALALVVNEIVTEAEKADKEASVRLVSRVAIAYANIGETETAQRFLNAVFPDPLMLYSDDFGELGEAVSVFSQLARTYAQVGDVETQQALLARTFELYIPEDLPEVNQLEAWQAIMFEPMAQNYAQISNEKAADALDVLLQVSENGWDYSFPVYLASLAQAELERGDLGLMQQRLDKAITLLDFYEYGTPPGAGFGRLLRTLTRLAEVYATVPDEAVKTAGLRSLSQAAEGLAISPAQQRLLGVIALAYSL